MDPWSLQQVYFLKVKRAKSVTILNIHPKSYLIVHDEPPPTHHHTKHDPAKATDVVVTVWTSLFSAIMTDIKFGMGQDNISNLIRTNI